MPDKLIPNERRLYEYKSVFTYTDNTTDDNDKIMENLHKQVIDGVDVSECKNFSCGKCEEENKIPRTINHFTTDCRMYPNCYYKQLKRKEQECEELKETLAEIKEICNAESYLSPQSTRLLVHKILQEISEVIPNEN